MSGIRNVFFVKKILHFTHVTWVILIQRISSCKASSFLHKYHNPRPASRMVGQHVAGQMNSQAGGQAGWQQNRYVG